MQHYNSHLTLEQGLAEYLAGFGLGDGGYANRWFRINLFWKVTLVLPNISNRRRAVQFHDLHHVLTEYSTGLKGEAEIGAWEIASGCGIYYAAWILNFGTLLYGIILYPRSIFHAFIRGRHSENLYHRIAYSSALTKTIQELRDSLHILQQPAELSIVDVVLFGIWALAAIAIDLFPFAVILLILR